MNTESPFSLNINQTSAFVGLSPSVLRIWELRYGWPAPRRFANGGRSYRPDQAEEIKAVAELVKKGNPIGSLIHDGRAWLKKVIEVDKEAEDWHPPLGLTGRVGFTIMEPMSYNKKSSPIYREWMDDTIRYMRNKYLYHGGHALFNGPVEVLIRTDNDTRADADNLIKPLLDAVTRAGIWEDDRQVKTLTVRKGAVATPIHLSIWRHEEQP